MVTNVKLTPLAGALGVQWTVDQQQGNTITVGWRVAGSGLAWSNSPQMRFPVSARTCTIPNLIDGTSYEVLVQHATFAAGKSAVATPREPVAKLRLGLINASQVPWVNANTVCKQALGAGVLWDRIDVDDGSQIRKVDAAVSYGMKALPLYNPGTGPSGGLNNRTAPQVAGDVATLARQLLARGITELEIGNEMWLNGDTAASYAAKYAAAWTACRGFGITLIAMVTGSYDTTGNGDWSDDASAGWIRDFVKALPAGVKPDAFSCHPYPEGGVTVRSHEDTGWPAVASWHAIAESLGIDVPWYITEVGLRVSDAGGRQQQADGLARMLKSLTVADPGIPGTPYTFVAFLSVYTAVDDSASDDWGLFERSDGSARPAWASLALAAR